MKTLLKILLLTLLSYGVKGQTKVPNMLPFPNAPFSYYVVGYMKADSAVIDAVRDTSARPKFAGFRVLWQHVGVDTSVWEFDGDKYVKQTGVATFNGRSGTVLLTSADIVTALGGTPLLNITNYIQGGSNVTITGLGTLASPYVINSSGGGGGGTVASFSFTNGNGIIGTVTNSTTTPNLSLSTALNGIVNANGTGFGTVTVGSGLNYAGGVLTATGGTSLNGLIYGNGSIFATVTIGAGLSFATGTLTNTINNTNQLTNGSGYITNITGLIQAGTNVSITGSGTSGSPYVINSSGGGGSGTVTTVSATSLIPLFATAVSNPSTIPGISFTLSNAPANSVFGNNTGSTGAPSYYVPSATILNGWFGGTLQAAISLTLTGSGNPTFVSNVLNIPPPTLGYVRGALNNTVSVNPGKSITLLVADPTHAGLIDSAHYHYLDSLFLGQKTFTLNALQGLYAINSNTIGLGGNPFTLPDTIKTAGFAFSITGLPNKATALGTDSVMIEDAAGKIWKLPVPAGGGGGTPGGSNTQVQFNNSGSFGGSANLTWSGTVLSTTGLTATGVTTLSGVTYSGGGATFDVLVTDTTSGKVWRQPYYLFDTTGFAGGSTNVIFNGTKLLLNAGGGGSFSYTVATPPATANYTVTTSNFILLPDLTGQANRNIVLPTSPATGAILTVKNNNTVTSTFNWTFTNGTVKSYNNTSITTLSTLTVYSLVFDGSAWDITN